MRNKEKISFLSADHREQQADRGSPGKAQQHALNNAAPIAFLCRYETDCQREGMI